MALFRSWTSGLKNDFAYYEKIKVSNIVWRLLGLICEHFIRCSAQSGTSCTISISKGPQMSLVLLKARSCSFHGRAFCFPRISESKILFWAS